MSTVIAVVDYGMGNLRSVSKALEHVVDDSQRIIVTSDVEEIANADRIVFPGQGAARDCMQQLQKLQLDTVVMQAAKEKPFLGICMGMQVLMSHSEENQGIDCMSFCPGNVRALADALSDPSLQTQKQSLKIPHMGWNKVLQKQAHPLWQGIDDNARFYFVHSYYVDPAEASLTAGETQYGIEFVSAIAKDNVFAVQFHPEKSAQDGLQLLKNFSRWNGQV